MTYLGCWVHREFQLGLFAVIHTQTLKEQGSESRTSSSTKGVKDQESLETGAVVCELADSVQDQVDNLLSDGVVTTRIVVGRILLSGDELLGVEELSVRSGSDLVDHGWLEIDKDGTWDVLGI